MQAMSDDDADRSVSSPEDDDDRAYIVPNGRPSTSKPIPDPKHRSTSSTIHDRSSFAAPSRPTAPSSAHLAVAQSGGGIPPFASPYGASPSSASAKESFLNYFFGGSEMGVPGQRSERLSLPDIGKERGDNPLSGRRGLEGNAAAFDMKSLEKHLEAVSSLLHPCGRRRWS